MLTQKEKATSFLQLAANGKVEEAYDQFIAKDFIHHNQYFKGDRESLKKGMEESLKTHPNKWIEIKHIYEDGDTVITNSHIMKENMEIMVAHIFRFVKGKIVELWDIGQIIEKDSPNRNGMF